MSGRDSRQPEAEGVESDSTGTFTSDTRSTSGTPTIGLVSHAVSVGPSDSSYIGYRAIETALGADFAIKRLSPWVREFPLAGKLRAAREFVSGCDVLLTTSRHVDVLRARAELDHGPPVAHLVFGDLPRGAVGLRDVLPLLRPDDAIVVTSQADMAILKRLVSDPPCHSTLIPLTVDTELFRPIAPRERDHLRACWGFAPEDVVFLNAGRMPAEKNLQDAVTVLGGVVRRDPRVRFVGVGHRAYEYGGFKEFGVSGYHTRRTIGELFKRSLPDRNCRWIDWKSQGSLPELYGCADVFISLTLNQDENFGYTQVEAMACGLPVVGTDWGGLRDTIDDGVVGYRVRTVLTDWGVYCDRLQALQRCLALAASPGLRRRMGAAGRERAQERYAMAPFREAFSALVRRLLRGRLERNAGSPPHPTLTPFGAAYHRAFCHPAAADHPAKFEGDATPPRYDSGNYHLYKGLIEPYASGTAPHPLGHDDRLSLAPLSCTIHDHHLQTADPLWPRSVSLSAVEENLVSMLLSRPYVATGQLLEAMKDQPHLEEVPSAVHRLIRLGVVFQSTSRTPDDGLQLP